MAERPRDRVQLFAGLLAVVVAGLVLLHRSGAVDVGRSTATAAVVVAVAVGALVPVVARRRSRRERTVL